MTLGLAPRQADLFRSTAAFCEGRVAPDSIYGVLHRECFRLFPDVMFGDLFEDAGRRSVPPMIVAVVMVLQRIEGCSDREAADRFAFDARWKYAAGGLDFDYPGYKIRNYESRHNKRRVQGTGARLAGDRFSDYAPDGDQHGTKALGIWR